jgi:hypothetical protein
LREVGSRLGDGGREVKEDVFVLHDGGVGSGTACCG